MHEILRQLPQGATVLDLGCASGSFDSHGRSFKVVRIDLERNAEPLPNFAQADAAKLPFPAHSFEAVVSNHSIEHFDDLPACLSELGRVVKPSGALYIAVPDASTVSDRLYRWLARGGGHVNAFRSAPELAALVERATGLKNVATRTLCTSLSCLNRRNRRTRAPRRLLLIGGGGETSLRWLSYFFRLSDRFLHTRMSVYGWAFYFGNVEAPIDCRTWSNVCVYCGSGHPSDWLREGRHVRRGAVFLRYRCPSCETTNLFTDDKHHLTY